jgi:hypothetical protein
MRRARGDVRNALHGDAPSGASNAVSDPGGSGAGARR